MRLLQRVNASNYTVTDDGRADDIPPYAILSHTWGPDEVTYNDVRTNPDDWQRKAGYDKIKFCADQAKRHGLQHFWVDTCCIDRSDAVELQTAINSMFRWYRNAKRCYVFLSDVSCPSTSCSSISTYQPRTASWNTAFRDSRWFKRGWTLQELIAPQIVEFYSAEGVFLGDKKSLEAVICDVTGIPAPALRNTPLSDFTTSEREAWSRNRETKYEEDMVYSLLGIFGVYMLPNYGEGRENAQRRLREEVQKSLKGAHFNDFSITFSLSGVPEALHFVARDRELAEMRRTLLSDGRRRAVVLHGLGGIGKTQLAATYINRYRDEYSAIFWLNVNDEASIQQSFARIATQILEQSADTGSLEGMSLQQDRDEIVKAVKVWFSLPGNTRWLIVYDNYDNPKLPGRQADAAVDIHRFLPMADQGSVIITTRLSQIDIGHHIRIEKLKSEDESLQILSKASGRNGLQYDGDAQELARKLDGLPLALATAGAYLKRVPVSIHNYLRHYEKSWARITGNLYLGSYADRTLSSTWQLSYEQVQAQNPLAAHLLRWWAYFNNEDIWFDLLWARAEEGPAWMKQLSTELEFNDAIGVLHDYGLVEPTVTFQEPQGYSIHGCLHSWTIHILNEEWDGYLNKLAIECVAWQVPSDLQGKTWLLQKRLLPHAIQSCSTVQESNVPLDRAFHSLGRLYDSQEKFDDAEKMYLRALDGRERALGPDHTSTLKAANNLGVISYKQGKLDEAETMYLRALDGMEKALGLDHTSTLQIVNNLGLIYRDQGKLNEAEKIFLRALDGMERVLGPDHTLILPIVHNLRLLYSEQGKFDKAEKICLRALDGIERALGLDHTSTLKAANNLGLLYSDQGKFDKAEKIFLRALDGMERALGPDHTLTLQTVHNLGVISYKQGKLDEAETMYLRALDRKERVLGPDHISILQTVNNLGVLYRDQGKLDEAEKMYLRALGGYAKLVGPDNVTTYPPAITTLNNLENLRSKQDRPMEGRQSYHHARGSLEELHEPSCPDVQLVRHDLELSQSASNERLPPIDDRHLADPTQPQPAERRRRRDFFKRVLGSHAKGKNR